MSGFTTKEVSEVPNAAALWQGIVDASPLAWFWHTWSWKAYTLAACAPLSVQDRSFFIYDDDTLAGLCPLILQRRLYGGKEWVDAAYYAGALLPWPLTTTPEAEDFAFQEIERRARKAGAAHIGVQLITPVAHEDERMRAERTALAHGYIAASGRSHVVEVPGALAHARERFRRYDKKFSPLFDFDILQGTAVDDIVEEEYFRLHVLDAGGQFRPRESYAKQADLARKGEAFYVRARHKEGGEAAGILLVSLYKNSAFDNSVAIDPRFAKLYVGHMLRFRALEELERRGAAGYGMPLLTEAPSFLRIPSQKQRGISYFKEGFSRGGSRTIWSIEKFLDAEYLHLYLTERETALAGYFKL